MFPFFIFAIGVRHRDAWQSAALAAAPPRRYDEICGGFLTLVDP